MVKKMKKMLVTALVLLMGITAVAGMSTFKADNIALSEESEVTWLVSDAQPSTNWGYGAWPFWWKYHEAADGTFTVKQYDHSGLGFTFISKNTYNTEGFGVNLGLQSESETFTGEITFMLTDNNTWYGDKGIGLRFIKSSQTKMSLSVLKVPGDIIYTSQYSDVDFDWTNGEDFLFEIKEDEGTVKFFIDGTALTLTAPGESEPSDVIDGIMAENGDIPYGKSLYIQSICSVKDLVYTVGAPTTTFSEKITEVVDTVSDQSIPFRGTPTLPAKVTLKTSVDTEIEANVVWSGFNRSVVGEQTVTGKIVCDYPFGDGVSDTFSVKITVAAEEGMADFQPGTSDKWNFGALPWAIFSKENTTDAYSAVFSSNRQNEHEGFTLISKQSYPLYDFSVKLNVAATGGVLKFIFCDTNAWYGSGAKGTIGIALNYLAVDKAILNIETNGRQYSGIGEIAFDWSGDDVLLAVKYDTTVKEWKIYIDGTELVSAEDAGIVNEILGGYENGLAYIQVHAGHPYARLEMKEFSQKEVVVSVPEITDKSVKRGTEPELPTSVEVVLSDGTKVSRSVTWSGTFDKDTVGKYVLTGKIAGEENYVGISDTYTVNVEVYEGSSISGLANGIYDKMVGYGKPHGLPLEAEAVLSDDGTVTGSTTVTIEWTGNYNPYKPATYELTGTLSSDDYAFDMERTIKVLVLVDYEEGMDNYDNVGSDNWAKDGLSVDYMIKETDGGVVFSSKSLTPAYPFTAFSKNAYTLDGFSMKLNVAGESERLVIAFGNANTWFSTAKGIGFDFVPKGDKIDIIVRSHIYVSADVAVDVKIYSTNFMDIAYDSSGQDFLVEVKLFEGKYCFYINGTRVEIADAEAVDIVDTMIRTYFTQTQAHINIHNFDKYVRLAISEVTSKTVITNIPETKDVTVYLGQDVSLPQTIRVMLSNGKQEDLAVTWAGTYDKNKVGTYEYVGTIEDKYAFLALSNTIEINVKVEKLPVITSVAKQDDVKIAKGSTYDLPTLVIATLDDGTQESISVTWSGTVDVNKTGKYVLTAVFDTEYEVASGVKAEITVVVEGGGCGSQLSGTGIWAGLILALGLAAIVLKKRKITEK